ncbi:MAG: AAA family ATPase [Gammaproteobacteria bacterium]|nr:AAA family ATPase [Gammaproteobacteria bacterium]
MTSFVSDARRLPPHHITIRVPWHDGGWTGHVCSRPLDNTSCLILPRIGNGRRDDVEARCAGERFDELDPENLPPCVGERVSFMAPFALRRTITHPYKEAYPETHGHFEPTRFEQAAYSAACVPFRWMLREQVEGSSKEGEMGIAERLKIGWVADREPEIRNQQGKEVETAWVQQHENQLSLLDTFFGALRPQESLCFFYAKGTPLSEQSRRVIVGVGRVLSVGDATEYNCQVEDPPLRCVLWERNVGHSVRPGFADGFLFPYQEALELAESEGVDPEEFVAFAPDECFNAYSYGCELLTHDGAVASLVACAATLHRIRGRIEGPWDQALAWIDTQINRLWEARGAFPGLGSALSAFGYEWGFRHGSLLAYEVELLLEREGDRDPWALVDEVMGDPTRLGGSLIRHLTAGLRNGWMHLTNDRRTLLQLLARCSISEGQALRIYDTTARAEAGIGASDADLLCNPYLLFELDRRAANPIAFGSVDRGLFPDEAIRQQFPVLEPSLVEDPADPRRVRALVVDLLEQAASEGHTLLPRSWVIRNARDRSLWPPCPLGENVLDACEGSFDPVIQRVAMLADEPAYQVERLVDCRAIIRREVFGRKRGRQHMEEFEWRQLVDDGIDEPLPEKPQERKLEKRARDEKAAALEQCFRSRLSILIGPAGTGKTTLLKVLCSLPGLADKGLLLLAPTGKARVRLEVQTGMQGAGQTLAQFLIQQQRYDRETSAYFPNRKAPRCGDYRTVIVDECSMLTEEQLAALIDSLRNVERLVLVGDPRQLPPIGAGRPFVDIVRELEPDDLETRFPRCGPGYAELTIPRRQQGENRSDVLLASQFSGRPPDPGVDAVLDQAHGGVNGRLRLIQWTNPQELQERLVGELVESLGLTGSDDELGFEESLGGSRHGDIPWAFFWNKYRDRPGAAAKAEAWQLLSPVRSGVVGVDALTRMIQSRFRVKVRELADTEGWGRKVPRPIGPQTILYGDKVINVINQRRRDVWPNPDREPYLANGDIGIVVGQYKTQRFKGLPWKLQVEFAGQLGPMYGFSAGEFGDEGRNPLELAYCLTVHKTQGSQFKVTFVVLKNPCWLLSRELLYTALTRHEDRLVVLHEGPLAEYRRYAGDEHSEIARRITNLFIDPQPREVSVKADRLFLEEGLIHRTERGDLVRSKSELVIADKLHARGIDYAYEQPLALTNGRTRYPDFTISDDARGVVFYWEHLGMLDDPGYRARWERKRAEYLECGIVPYDQGDGPEGTLIETCDEQGGTLDASAIAKVIDDVILG